MNNENVDTKYVNELPSGKKVDHDFYKKLTDFVMANKNDNEKIRECCSFLSNYPPFVTEYSLEYIVAEYDKQKTEFSQEKRNDFIRIMLNEKIKTYQSTFLYVDEYKIVSILSKKNVYQTLAHFFINHEDKDKAINEYCFILSGMNENDIIKALFTLKAIYETYIDMKKYFRIDLKTSLIDALFYTLDKKHCTQHFKEHAIDVLSGYIEIGLWNTFFGKM